MYIAFLELLSTKRWTLSHNFKANFNIIIIILFYCKCFKVELLCSVRIKIIYIYCLYTIEWDHGNIRSATVCDSHQVTLLYIIASKGIITYITLWRTLFSFTWVLKVTATKRDFKYNGLYTIYLSTVSFRLVCKW